MIEFKRGIFSTAYERHKDEPEIADRIIRLHNIAMLINSLNYVLFISKKNKKAMLVTTQLAEDMQVNDMIEIEDFDDFCIAMTQSTITGWNVETYKLAENIVEYLNSLTKDAQDVGEGNKMVMAKSIVHFDNN